MLWGKQKQLEQWLADYRREVMEGVREMVKTFERCQGDYDISFLRESGAKVHAHERKADDIRREIEVLMYSKALFPESRGDILGLIEAMDKLANQAEKVVWMMLTHRLAIPREFQGGMLALAKVCEECSEALIEAAEKLFTNFAGATEAIGKVDQLESDADRREAALTEEVFTSSLDGFQKLLMRDLIRALAQISDRAESVADRIRITVAKRRA